MLAIKLRRVGKKHQASFRVITTEKKSKLQGKFIEDLGWFNPHTDEMKIDKERAGYWVKVGAQPTDSVHNLLVRAGVLTGPKIPVHAKSKKKEEAPAAEAPAVAETSADAKAMADKSAGQAASADKASAGQAGQTEEKPVE